MKRIIVYLMFFFFLYILLGIVAFDWGHSAIYWELGGSKSIEVNSIANLGGPCFHLCWTRI